MERFLDDCRVRNLSERTIEKYGGTLRRLLVRVPDFLTADRAVIRGAVVELFTGQPATYNRHLAAVKSLYRWACDEGLREADPVVSMRQAKLAQRLPRAVDEAPLRAAFVKFGKGVEDRRDRALAHLLLSSGLRVSEALALDLGDIGERMTIIGKGDKQRVVFVDPAALQDLRAWIKIRPVWNPRDDALFIGERGARLDSRRAQEAIKARLGVTPHQLRHTFATMRLRKGMDLVTLMTLMGHSKITTTQNYLKVSDDLSRAAYLRTV